MNIEPCQDWMLLEPLQLKSDVSLLLPDNFDPTAVQNRKDLMGFKVTKIGPWPDYPLEASKSWAEHGICVGDIVMVEGMNFAMIELDGKKFAVSRARNVIYKVTDAEDRYAPIGGV